MRITIMLPVALLGIFTVALYAQPTTPPATPTPAPASSATVAVESEMIAYEAIGEIAQQIAGDINCAIVRCDPGKKPRPASSDKTVQKEQTTKVLLATPANMAAISAYQSFVAASQSLQTLYNAPMTSAAPKPHIGAAQAGGTFTALASPVQDAASALASLKASTTQAGSSFAPADQALYSYLEKYCHSLVTMPYPGNYADGNALLTKELQTVIDLRSQAILAYQKNYNSTHPNPADQEKYDPTTDELKGVEASYNSFIGLLTGANATSIAMGAALRDATKDDYLVLTVSDVAAGGSTRANTYFLLNIFVPAPRPSFNGGAVVAYTLMDQKGHFKDANMYRLVYNYTKWAAPQLHKKDQGFANFRWSGEDNDGPIHHPY